MAGQQQVLHAVAEGRPPRLETALDELLWVPPAFCCPVYRTLMADPVLAEDGHSYERRAIQSWLQRSAISPSTNLPMGRRLFENVTLRQAIEQYVEAASSPAVSAAFSELQDQAHDFAGAFTSAGAIACGGCRFRAPRGRHGRVPFDVQGGRLRCLDRGVIWSEEEFDLAQGDLRVALSLAFDRAGARNVLVGFSANGHSWEEGGCDALTVGILAREFEQPAIWIRARMFSEQIAYGPVANWPAPGEVGRVSITLTHESLSMEVFGTRTRTFDVHGKVPARVSFGFINWDDTSCCDCCKVHVA